jgi:hypothetical protein
MSVSDCLEPFLEARLTMLRTLAKMIVWCRTRARSSVVWEKDGCRWDRTDSHVYNV